MNHQECYFSKDDNELPRGYIHVWVRDTQFKIFIRTCQTVKHVQRVMHPPLSRLSLQLEND